MKVLVRDIDSSHEIDLSAVPGLAGYGRVQMTVRMDSRPGMDIYLRDGRKLTVAPFVQFNTTMPWN